MIKTAKIKHSLSKTWNFFNEENPKFSTFLFFILHLFLLILLPSFQTCSTMSVAQFWKNAVIYRFLFMLWICSVWQHSDFPQIKHFVGSSSFAFGNVTSSFLSFEPEMWRQRVWMSLRMSIHLSKKQRTTCVFSSKEHDGIHVRALVYIMKYKIEGLEVIFRLTLVSF